MALIWPMTLSALALTGPTVEWQQIRNCSGSVPDARRGHSAVLDAPASRMLLVGGCGTGAYRESSADVNALSLGALGWSHLSPAPNGVTLSPRSGASLVPVDGRLLLFGGNVGGVAP